MLPCNLPAFLVWGKTGGRVFAAPSTVEAVRVAPLPRLVHPAWVQVPWPQAASADLWSLGDLLELRGMVLYARTIILAVSSIMLTLAWFPSIPVWHKCPEHPLSPCDGSVSSSGSPPDEGFGFGCCRRWGEGRMPAAWIWTLLPPSCLFLELPRHASGCPCVASAFLQSWEHQPLACPIY